MKNIAMTAPAIPAADPDSVESTNAVQPKTIENALATLPQKAQQDGLQQTGNPFPLWFQHSDSPGQKASFSPAKLCSRT